MKENNPTPAKWNAYKAKFWIQTVRRAEIEGVHVYRSYGYVVRVSPAPPSRPDGIYAWCKTKVVAVKALADYQFCQRKGFWACPCGSDKQAVLCCGIPEKV